MVVGCCVFVVLLCYVCVLLLFVVLNVFCFGAITIYVCVLVLFGVVVDLFACCCVVYLLFDSSFLCVFVCVGVVGVCLCLLSCMLSCDSVLCCCLCVSCSV